MVFLLFWLGIFIVVFHISDGVVSEDNTFSLILHSFTRSLPCLFLVTYFSLLSPYSFLSAVTTFKTSDASFTKSDTFFRSDSDGTEIPATVTFTPPSSVSNSKEYMKQTVLLPQYHFINNFKSTTPYLPIICTIFTTTTPQWLITPFHTCQ